jgi:hypothetical protein
VTEYNCPVCHDTRKLRDGSPCDHCFAITVDTSCSACKAKDEEIERLLDEVAELKAELWEVGG